MKIAHPEKRGAMFMNRKFYIKILYVFIFTAAFAFVESAVVIYLRHIYYPEGFHFPIKKHIDLLLYIEVIREFATLVIMVSISVLLSKPARRSQTVSQGKNPDVADAGGSFWEGFGYFLIIFGVWDIFFYIWLKAAINWPASLFDPDILFLIPVPWIAPVLAPVLISLVMIIIGIDITRLSFLGYTIKPHLTQWIMVLAGSFIILYSFMNDAPAMFYEKYPQPYNWFLLVIGLILYITAHSILHRKIIKEKPAGN